MLLADRIFFLALFSELLCQHVKAHEGFELRSVEVRYRFLYFNPLQGLGHARVHPLSTLLLSFLLELVEVERVESAGEALPGL